MVRRLVSISIHPSDLPRLLSTRQFSRLGGEFDLLRYTRFLELFAYFSPAHGYSLQTTFLGLSAVLMGTNVELKRETVAALEAGGLLAFGISERGHGSDLLGGEFTVSEVDAGQFVANGAKYYIGNSNCADFISILARKNIAGRADHLRRAPFILFALRPRASKGFHSVKKIHTLGVRAGFVGEFEVQDHPLSQRDVIAEGREAWSAVFGTVTLGKLFLGFGSIGICEHALEEAVAHLRGRTLYGKPAADMPHLRATMAQAYARLTAMKLYAYRALDYVHAADAADRRYLLFAAVQKAKVSTEGVKVMAMLSECIGAKGFEADTYFEMALRDIQLIPGLEGSTHINLGLTAQFIPRYFADSGAALRSPDSLVAGEIASHENPYLFAALGGGLKNIAFPHFLDAYRPLAAIANVRLFAKAAKAFQLLVRDQPVEQSARADTPMTLALGQCLATIAYAQLIAENAVRLGMEMPLVSVIFHALSTRLQHGRADVCILPRVRRNSPGLVSPHGQHSKCGQRGDRFRGAADDGDRRLPRAVGMNTEQSLFWRLLQHLLRPSARLLFNLKVYGAENVPASGGALIVSNHQSYLDPILLPLHLNRPLNYIAKSELFVNPIYSWFLRSVLNAFPVRQGHGDVRAVKETIRRLKEGHLMNIFPEGSRTYDGEIALLQGGSALIVHRARVPVVPAVICGAYDAWPIQRKFPRCRPIWIQFGPPMELAALSNAEIVAVIDRTLRSMFAALRAGPAAPPTPG